MVPSGFMIAWRFATWPTRRWPSSVKATTEGVTRPPSALGMISACPPSITAATAELVVPRSMPTAFAMCSVLLSSGSRARRLLLLFLLFLPLRLLTRLSPVPVGLLDLDVPGLLLLGPRYADHENAVPELRLHASGIDSLGQHEAARELPHHSLAGEEALVVLLTLLAPLAGDDQRAIPDVDRDVVAVHPGEVDPQDDLVVRLLDIHRGQPRRPARLLGVGQEAAEGAVELALNLCDLLNRIPPCHGRRH